VIKNLSCLYRPLSDRSARYNRGFFIKHKWKLTTLPILRYSSGHRKGRLKILSILGQGLAYIDYSQQAAENWELHLTAAGLAAAHE
jgi:hypothetical protein